MRIGSHTIDADHPTYIVAELGGNAHQDYQQAKDLIRAAADAGADACKVQVFTPDSMTLDVDQPSHRLDWHGKPYTLHALYAETAMPMEWHEPLMEFARACRLPNRPLDYFGSVFSQAGIDLAVRLGMPALKIASFEANDYPLIRAAAKTKLPILLSLGMATATELRDAIRAANEGVCSRIKDPVNWIFASPASLVLLHCTTAYPAPVEAANLLTLTELREIRYRTDFTISERGVSDQRYAHYPVGLSDHSRSNAVVCAAVALGARIVERHLTLDRSAGGPDAPFSDEPHEFAAMVRAIRDTEAALGTVHYGPTESERPMLRYRRSIWITQDVAAGDTLTPDNLAVLRPADGLPPSEWERVLGRRAARALPRGTALQEEHLGG